MKTNCLLESVIIMADYVDFEETYDEYEAVDNFLTTLQKEGNVVEIDAMDVMKIVNQTGARSLHYVGKFCKQNQENIWDCISLMGEDAFEYDEELKSEFDSLAENYTVAKAKKFVRDYGDIVCLHHYKNHIISLVY